MAQIVHPSLLLVPQCLLTVECGRMDEDTAGETDTKRRGSWKQFFDVSPPVEGVQCRDGVRDGHTHREVMDKGTKATAFNMKQNFRGGLQA